MRKFIIILFIILTSCTHDDESKLLFIGDSHIAYWDVNHYFVQTVNINEGKIGQKLIDITIKDKKHSNVDKLIIISGFNDMHELYGKTNSSEELVDSIVLRYITFIKRLNINSENYLVSLFPIGKEYENQEFVRNCSNSIRTINSRVKDSIKNYQNIHFLEIYPALVDDEGYLKEIYTNDGLHLNNQGYSILTNITLRYVQ